MKYFKVVGLWLAGSIALLLITLLALNTFTYLNFDPNYGFLRLKQEAIRTGWYLPAYYSHVLIAGIVLLIGFFQIITRISLKWRKLHRLLGRVYVYGILFFAAPGGLLMSFFIQRGPWVLASFMLQSILWFVFTAIAVTEARKNNIEKHRKWMLRSYSLAFAAVTLRLYAFISSDSINLSDPGSYEIIAWMSWLLNLVAVELYLHYNKKVVYGKEGIQMI